jgi:hypothetical protein
MIFFNAHNLGMTPERQQFVERLIDIVELLKYPAHGRQTALAARYKLKQPSVRKWFTGEAMPSYEIAIDLCKRALVSYEWLMTGRGEKFGLPTEMLDPQILAANKVMQQMTPYQLSQVTRIIDTFAEPAKNGTKD